MADNFWYRKRKEENETIISDEKGVDGGEDEG